MNMPIGSSPNRNGFLSRTTVEALDLATKPTRLPPSSRTVRALPTPESTGLCFRIYFACMLLAVATSLVGFLGHLQNPANWANGSGGHGWDDMDLMM
ncbi:MAG: hypothetical protein KDK78_09900 [Chlamydiia bacterium]|nr:hypothetical protein [Chlamydiia bacterium]